MAGTIVSESGLTLPPYRGAELVYRDLAVPVNVDQSWIQPDGTYNASQATAKIFDLRRFRAIATTFAFTSLSGGTSPRAGLLIDIVDDNDASAFLMQRISPTSLAPNTGGASIIYAGEMNAVAASGGAYNNIGQIVITPLRINFAYIGPTNTGTPTAVNGGRIHVWGFY
jgi:hypothetical protein